MTGTPKISVEDLDARLRRRLNGKDDFIVLDVREDFELDIAQLPHSYVHIPLSEVLSDDGRRVAQLAGEREVFVLCRSGGRSAQATEFLRQREIAATNIAGGILAWSRTIDPSIQTY